MSLLDRILRIGLRTAETVVRDQLRNRNRSPQQQGQPSAQRSRRTDSAGPSERGTSGSYPGDFTGQPRLEYSPHPGEMADPGEIAWTWVPYEEDHSQGKDRPVLIVGRDGEWLVAVQLTSQDHDRDAEQEARAGRYWIDIGTGNWDKQGRPSEVRVNRLIRVDPDAVRTDGVRVDESVFNRVAEGIRKHY